MSRNLLYDVTSREIRGKWTQPRRTFINNGGLTTYLFVATRKEDPEHEEGISKREIKRRRAKAWHASQAAIGNTQ
jgi:hypothetical protein